MKIINIIIYNKRNMLMLSYKIIKFFILKVINYIAYWNCWINNTLYALCAYIRA